MSVRGAGAVRRWRGRDRCVPDVCGMSLGVGSVRRVSEGSVGISEGCKSKCHGCLLFHWQKRALLRSAVRQLRAVPGPCRGSAGDGRAPWDTASPGRQCQCWSGSEFM